MLKEFGPLDKQILNTLQFEFPLTISPFCTLAEKLGISFEFLAERILTFKKKGIVRQISPVFDSARLGYKSALAAFSVDEQDIENTALYLNTFAGVTHNYLRDNAYNIWFTLTLPGAMDIAEEVNQIKKACRVKKALFLPALKTYKIGFSLKLDEKYIINNLNPANRDRAAVPPVSINQDFVKYVQRDLPLEEHPYKEVALELGITEDEVLAMLKNYLAHNIIRRIAAILSPVKSGFIHNVMAVWAIADEYTDIVGNYASAIHQISHCYLRPKTDDWPYSLYTMIHTQTPEECNTIIEDLKNRQGIMKFETLKTIKEFKKKRVLYFS